MWVLMLATSYTHKTLVSVVSTLPSAATTETPNERGRTRGQQPPLLWLSTASSRYVSLIPMQPVPAVAGCLDKALSLCFTDTSSRIPLVFQGHGSSSQPPWLTGNRKRGKDRECCVCHTCHYTCHLDPGILREPCSHPSASALFWENVSLPDNDRREGRIQIGFRKDAERL